MPRGKQSVGLLTQQKVLRAAVALFLEKAILKPRSERLQGWQALKFFRRSNNFLKIIFLILLLEGPQQYILLYFNIIKGGIL